MQLGKDEIKQLDKVYRLNLINALTGIKPANLIASCDEEGKDNVAIFSSVLHLGSSPAQLGFNVRPAGRNPRDTLKNIEKTGFYSINHISQSFIHQAHCTSVNLKADQSEFERMNLHPERIPDFVAPFVKESAVKIGMKHIESIILPNKSTFVIGEIVHIKVPDESLNVKGEVDLAAYDCVGVSGLGTYYTLNKVGAYGHIKANEIPKFK